MDDNTILFTTTTTLTFEEYVRSSDRVCRTANFLSYALWFGAGCALTILALSNSHYERALLTAAACLCGAARGRTVRKQKQEAEFQAPDGAANCTFTYEFYNNFYRQTCDNIPSDPIPYYELRKIIETDTNFYLVYARRECSVIIKKNCTAGLVRFLHNLRENTDSPFYNKPGKAKPVCSELSSQIIKKIGCPYEIIQGSLSNKEIMRQYHQAMNTAEQDGYPILVASDGIYLEQLEIMEDEHYDRDAMLAGEHLNGKEFLQKRYQEEMDALKEAGEDISFFNGTLKNGERLEEWAALDSFCGEYDEFILFHIPVDEPWKILAYTPLEAWNYDLETEEMLAVCHYWYDKYRAVPAVLSHDTMEFLAGKEVPTEQDAWDLAKEHYAFCPEQCSESADLGELADHVLKSSVWMFWWD